MLLHGAGPCVFDTPRVKSNREQETENLFPLFRNIGLHNVPGDILIEEPGVCGDVAAIYDMAVYVKKLLTTYLQTAILIKHARGCTVLRVCGQKIYYISERGETECRHLTS